MRLIEKAWYQNHPIKWLLLPFSLVFYLVSSLRKLAYKLGMFSSTNTGLPVVVVGNIGVGGNGKTPLVVYLVEQLKQQGWQLGVISRGYGSKAPYYPYLVSSETNASIAGDEPCLIANRTQVPVVISANRIAGIELLKQQGCNLVIADDGLQHYAMARTIELVVVDGKRHFGNGYLMPAGPLREPVSRLKSVDGVIINNGNKLAPNNWQMTLKPSVFVNLVSGEQISYQLFLNQFKQVNALAGIGDPSRFFHTLNELGFDIKQSVGFVDHHPFSAQDLAQFSQELPLVMTEKDAVKCQDFATDNCWYLAVDASFSHDDASQILNLINKRCKHYGL